VFTPNRLEETKKDKNSGKLKDSINVLKVVRPIDRGRDRIRYCLGRIKTEDLSKDILKRIFKEVKADIDVIEDDDYFILQYKNHSVLRISKKNSLFYSESGEENQEARIIWETLRKFGHVENPHRRVIRKPLILKWE
jgi:hypothetical protein